MKYISSEAISPSKFRLFSLTKSKSGRQFTLNSDIKSNLASILLDCSVTNPTFVSDLDSMTKSENLLNPAGCARESTVSCQVEMGTSDLIEYERFW